MEVSRDALFGLEDASTSEEVSMPAVALDPENRQKLLDLTNPKASAARSSSK